MLCIGCEWRLKPNNADSDAGFAVERDDRVQSLYLTTGDFSALQQMSTNYPIQTRTLICPTGRWRWIEKDATAFDN